MVLWKQRKSPHNSPLRRQNYQVSAFLIQKKGEFVCDLKYLPYLCTRKTEKYPLHPPFGALVQLVRIHACHAWGHGFESRTHRNIFQNQLAEFHFGFCFFCTHKIAAPRPQKIDNVCPFYQKTKRKSALSSGKSVFLQKEGACSFFGRLPVYPIIKICQRKHSRR